MHRIAVPLSRFAAYLIDAKRIDEEYPTLKQQQWLGDNFAFDNEQAHFEPMHIERHVSGRNDLAAFWRRLARN
jgi:hypothetical protein